jgi:ATP-dependent helicase/nuclease subunit A
MTRARDHLIIPLHAKKPTGEWLESLGADWLLPRSEELSLPDGSTIPTDFQVLEAPDGWARESEEYSARWVAPGEKREGVVNRNLSPSSADTIIDSVVGDVIELGERMVLDNVKDVTALGQAIHSLIAAEINSPDDAECSRAARVLREWGFEGSVEPNAASQAARRFIDWAESTFEPIAWNVEHPITHTLETGQVAQGFIDLLLETKDGWVIVDHKATPRPRNEWQGIAHGYSGQLAMYKSAVEAVSNRPVISTWIHLPVGGGVLPVGEALK